MRSFTSRSTLALYSVWFPPGRLGCTASRCPTEARQHAASRVELCDASHTPAKTFAACSSSVPGRSQCTSVVEYVSASIAQRRISSDGRTTLAEGEHLVDLCVGLEEVVRLRNPDWWACGNGQPLLLDHGRPVWGVRKCSLHHLWAMILAVRHIQGWMVAVQRYRRSVGNRPGQREIWTIVTVRCGGWAVIVGKHLDSVVERLERAGRS